MTTTFPCALRLTAMAAAQACALVGTGNAWGNPQLPQVIHGSATIAQQGTTLTVRNSPNSILNWGSFSIAPHEIT